ncbi:hypothetical protein [Nocardioides seonyuensis]|uniref:hypothetical protein n=1 Tax=Nocardioides seonyuensis TaxID=2518371 RepID=UPI001ABEA78D|nr:hypothetical protein [Nocardioides seonyuensis]
MTIRRRALETGAVREGGVGKAIVRRLEEDGRPTENAELGITAVVVLPEVTTS